MSKYQVLARKYRPQKFADVLGQQAIVSTLQNAIRMERVAHAYLFCGCRGTGKTTVARLFAKALNCSSLSPDCEPCNHCPSCKEIAAGQGLDVLEIDGASHRGIEDIRQINETIGFTPTHGRYKIYLIDEVHMLTKEAFNALLKTLEEPPSHAKFFFATTEPHKIPSTILSRCQRFNLGRLSSETIQKKLASIATDLRLSFEEDALFLIAERAEGSLRDAESLLDQVISFQKDTIVADTVRELLGLPSQEMFFALDEAGKDKKLVEAFSIAGQVFASGKNIPYFLEELIGHFRTLFLLKNGMAKETPQKERHQRSALYYRPEQLLQILDLILEAQTIIKSAPSERIAFEMLLLKILRTHQQISLENLVDRLVQLEIPPPPPISEKITLPSIQQEEKKIKPPEPMPNIPQQQAAASLYTNNLKNGAEAAQLEQVGCVDTIQQQSRFDTLMRFAAKELNASFKKES